MLQVVGSGGTTAGTGPPLACRMGPTTPRALFLGALALLLHPSAHSQSATEAERLFGPDPGSCRRWLSPDLWAPVWAEVHGMPVALYGIADSDGVARAAARLDAASVCYTKRLVDADDDTTRTPSGMTSRNLMQYMACEVWAAGGVTHPFSLDSFVWMGGSFRGDGFMLDAPADGGVEEHVLQALLSDAGAERNCVGGVPVGLAPCSPTVLTQSAAQVTAACCVAPAVCAGGVPDQCHQACRDVWTPFWEQCYTELSEGMVGDEPALRGLTSFAMACGAGKASPGAAPPGAGPPPISAVAGPPAIVTPAGAPGVLEAFRPTCGTNHASCSEVPIPQRGEMPVGVWSVSCTNDDSSRENDDSSLEQ